jgi:calmodulin
MGDKLRQEDLNDIKECFTLYDKDADGKISCQDLGLVIRSLGSNPTEAEVDDIARNMIRGPTFGLPELLQVMARFMGESRNKQEEIRESFSVFDRDGTGMISAAELRHVMTNIGEKLSDQEVDEMIREIEVDRDGQIQYEEMVRLMCG